MMRLLLILISLLSLKANSTEYFEYTIKPGDTLSQIANIYQVELEELYRANKFLGFNPNKIEVNQEINIPKEFKPELCPPSANIESTFVFQDIGKGYYLEPEWYSESLNELIETCFDQVKADELMELSEDKAIELILKDKEYESSFVLNSLTFNENPLRNKFMGTYCKALIKGVESYLKPAWWIDCQYDAKTIEDSPYNRDIKNALLFLSDHLDVNQVRQINFKALPLDFRVYVQISILELVKANPNQNISELLQQVSLDLRDQISSYPLFSNLRNLSNIANFIFYANNASREDLSIQILYDFLDVSCNRCDLRDLQQMITSRVMLDEFDPKDMKYFWSSLSMSQVFAANSLGAMENYWGSYELVSSVRNYFIEQILRMKTPSLSYLDRNLGIFYSDASMYAASHKKCDIAGEFIYKAFDTYNEFTYASDLFREPVVVANCFLKSGEINDAKQFFELALQSESIINKNNVYYEAIALLIKGLYNDVEGSFITDAYNLIIENNILTDQFLDDYYVALDTLFAVEQIKQTNSLDYVKLKNKLNSISTTKKLQKAKIFSKQNIEDLQLELEKVSLNIYMLESEIISSTLTSQNFQNFQKEKLLEFYDRKKDIVNSIFNQSSRIDSLYNGYENQNELMNKIPKNTKVLVYFIFKDSSWAVTYSPKSAILNKIDAKSGELKVQTGFLNRSLTDLNEYDFEAAHKIYEMIFSDIQQNFKKNSSILIFDSDTVRIPLSILVKSIPDESNYSKALITAEWLLRDYSFAYLYPTKNKLDNVEYQDTFLGIANSSSYSWTDLPSLKSSVREVRNLALSSNAKVENILTGVEATKENFLQKLGNNYERIVISTHAVPEGWKGYTGESSLLLASNKSDFFLPTSEIAQLEFTSDMVVLSSCSGMTDDFRDLFKSFLVAGAGSVVHANWKLESKFASEFTDEFFKELWLNKDLQKHEAMRNVALSFLDDYSNPMYADPAFWGNFSIGYSSL